MKQTLRSGIGNKRYKKKKWKERTVILNPEPTPGLPLDIFGVNPDILYFELAAQRRYSNS